MSTFKRIVLEADCCRLLATMLNPLNILTKNVKHDKNLKNFNFFVLGEVCDEKVLSFNYKIFLYDYALLISCL